MNRFVNRDDTTQESKGRALDLKLFIEEMNEVARAVGEITNQCGPGQSLATPPCDQLQPLLDERSGQEHEPIPGEIIGGLPDGGTLEPGYSAYLRSPFVPRWSAAWTEDVLVTDALAPDECAVVFKETRGLMLKVHLRTIIVVTDPWVATFGVPRGTSVPIWTLEPVPAQYAKTYNHCNTVIDNGDGTTRQGIEQNVTTRVVQDVPLKYFWRFYPNNR